MSRQTVFVPNALCGLIAVLTGFGAEQLLPMVRGGPGFTGFSIQSLHIAAAIVKPLFLLMLVQ